MRKISLDCQLPFYSVGITEFHLTSGNNEFLILTVDFDKFWWFASFTLLLFRRPCLICRFHSCVMIPSKLIPSKTAILTIIRKSLKTILRVLISSLANQIRSWHSNPRPIRKASSKNNHLVTSNFHPNYFLCLFKTAIKNYNRTWTLINLNTENLFKKFIRDRNYLQCLISICSRLSRLSWSRYQGFEGFGLTAVCFNI